MATLTIDKFNIGIDTRKHESVSDANRLRVCQNARVTNGGSLKKRPGLKHQVNLTANTKGLTAGQGKLNTFSKGAGVSHSDSRFVDHGLKADTTSSSTWAATTAYSEGDVVVPTSANHRRYRCTVAGTSDGSEPSWPTDIGDTVTDGTVTWTCEWDTPAPAWGASTEIAYVWFATIIAGYWCVVAEDADGVIRMFYLDGSTFNEVIDHNCPVNADQRETPTAVPSPPAFIKLASRVFGIEFELTPFCALDDPTDWTDNTASAGAGFLAVGRQALGSDEAKALGQYQGDMIVFFTDAAQSWNVDADSDFNSFQQSIDGVGCSFPLSVGNLAGDTFFLSDIGFR